MFSLLKSIKLNKSLVVFPSLVISSFLFKTIKKSYQASKPLISENDNRLLVNLPRIEEMEEGEMKEVKWGVKEGQSILVVKYNGKLHALSNYCPHYGAPLHTGVLIDNIVKCPWHGASFDIISGKTDISPSIDDLPIYTVEQTDDGENFCILPDKNDVKKFITPLMSKRDLNDKRRFIIIGGGPAGLSAAETLRQANYTGEILIISKDSTLPYDRTVLSKWEPEDVSKIHLRSEEFLKEYDIDIKTKTSIKGINKQEKSVVLEDGTILNYDKLLIASGSTARIPPFPGVDLPHVFSLRSWDDMKKITEKVKKSNNIVIVGGGFIGLETTAMYSKLNPNATITVVEGSESPFFFTLGKKVGSALQKYHESKGIKFSLNKNVKTITADSVILEDGSSINADMILLGTGASPNTVKYFYL
jgi:nitrite reductase/ring-hydroxylating ferredoxin subunit/thioredoxin reductase